MFVKCHLPTNTDRHRCAGMIPHLAYITCIAERKTMYLIFFEDKISDACTCCYLHLDLE